MILKPVCAALDFAHKHGVAHRDLKPSNIMLTGDGFVKVAEFSMGAPGDSSDYSAPEAEKGVVGPAADIYSLGICFHEMLTGESPARSPRDMDSGGETDRLVAAALEPDPARRIRSAGEFAARMERMTKEIRAS